MGTFTTVLTSAAVGVLASGLITLLGHYLERRARRDELILTKALEMAVHRTELGRKIAESDSVAVSYDDDVVRAETYARWLKSLLKTGQLPPDADQVRRE